MTNYFVSLNSSGVLSIHNNIEIPSGGITSDHGTINFDDEDLTTSGTITGNSLIIDSNGGISSSGLINLNSITKLNYVNTTLGGVLKLVKGSGGQTNNFDYEVLNDYIANNHNNTASGGLRIRSVDQSSNIDKAFFGHNVTYGNCCILNPDDNTNFVFKQNSLHISNSTNSTLSFNYDSGDFIHNIADTKKHIFQINNANILTMNQTGIGIRTNTPGYKGTTFLHQYTSTLSSSTAGSSTKNLVKILDMSNPDTSSSTAEGFSSSIILLTASNNYNRVEDEVVYSGIDFRNNYDIYTKISAYIRYTPTANFFRGALDFGVQNIENATSHATTAMRISADGNVGIGTTSPSAKLDVDGTLNVTGNISAAKDTESTSYFGNAAIGRASSADAHAAFAFKTCATGHDYALQQSSGGHTMLNCKLDTDIQFRSQNTTRIIMKSSGFLGIATTNPQSALDVHGNITNNGMLIFKGDISSHATNIHDEPWRKISSHAYQDNNPTGDGRYVRNYIRMQTPNNSHGYSFTNLQDWYIGTGYDGGTYTRLIFSTGTHQANSSYPDNIRYAGNIHSGFHNVNSGNYGDQMNFTGQHRCVPQNINFYNNIDNYIGLIVYATGKYKTYSNFQEKLTVDKEAITINDSLPMVDLSNKKKQKSVFGVISYKEEEERTYRAGNFHTPYPNINDDKRLYINSVGEGAIWIVNTNGNLENGDYIQASDVIGIGEKQDDDFLHNYTVAKITCDCNFDTSSTNYNCIEFVDPISGNTYKKAFVGCSYHCG